ncbi:hypothetical protein GCM10027075_61250 [Streptomyces heilongjiangensis]
MNHAGLDHGAGPHVVHRVRQSGQAVADEHQHIAGAAVLDLGEDLLPVLRTLAAVADPQSEDVALPVRGDRQGDVDRPVGDLPVADLGSVDDLVIRTLERAVPTVRDHVSGALVMCSWRCFRTCPRC